MLYVCNACMMLYVPCNIIRTLQIRDYKIDNIGTSAKG